MLICFLGYVGTSWKEIKKEEVALLVEKVVLLGNSNKRERRVVPSYIISLYLPHTAHILVVSLL
jgi:hypothetical protein